MLLRLASSTWAWKQAFSTTKDYYSERSSNFGVKPAFRSKVILHTGHEYVLVSKNITIDFPSFFSTFMDHWKSNTHKVSTYRNSDIESMFEYFIESTKNTVLKNTKKMSH